MMHITEQLMETRLASNLCELAKSITRQSLDTMAPWCVLVCLSPGRAYILKGFTSFNQAEEYAQSHFRPKSYIFHNPFIERDHAADCIAITGELEAREAIGRARLPINQLIKTPQKGN
jgi:hypothetical protein